jgi:purine-binding chemotaxis protein CheW
MSLDTQIILERAEHAAAQQTRSAADSSILTVLTFRWGDEVYGLPLLEVSEVAKVEAITPLPGLQPSLLGAMNLRGEILTVTDPRPLLGLEAGHPSPESRLIIFPYQGQPVGLLVDVIGDILTVSRPASLNEASNPIAAQVVLPDGLLLNLLNLPRILTLLSEES